MSTRDIVVVPDSPQSSFRSLARISSIYLSRWSSSWNIARRSLWLSIMCTKESTSSPCYSLEQLRFDVLRVWRRSHRPGELERVMRSYLYKVTFNSKSKNPEITAVAPALLQGSLKFHLSAYRRSGAHGTRSKLSNALVESQGDENVLAGDQV